MFNDLLNEVKYFKYQITVKVLLKKYRLSREIEFPPANFKSVTKTVINHSFRFEKASQEILYMIHVWTNNEFGLIVKSIESQYINNQLIDLYQEVLIWSYLLN